MEGPTPKSLGYSMPAEWHKHEATWLSWPKNPLTFPTEVIGRVEDAYCDMIAALTIGERVKLLVDDERAEEKVISKLESQGVGLRDLYFKRIKSADVWIRDYGPIFLLNRRSGKRVAVKWNFNAWGAKYDDLLCDDITGEEVAKESGVRVFRPGIVMEGGSIDINGGGSLLTTEQCLLNKNRNPQLSRRQIEAYLDEHLSAPNIVWLRFGIEGDDTDGHVDDFARFVSPSRVLCAHSKKGTNAGILQTNLGILRKSRDQNGEELQVDLLPLPRPLKLKEEDGFLPASYANFYIGNKVILLPIFNDPMDEMAISIAQECFPQRKVVRIQASHLVYGYGGIHCITQQEPALDC